LVRRAEHSAAARFLGELDRLIDLLAASPEKFPPFDTDLRRAMFQRLPFYLVFRADDFNVLVLAVAHGKSRPGFWRDRA